MNLPSTKESLTFLIALAAWMIVTALFIGIRPEHWLMGALLAFLFFITPSTRKLAIALLPFVVFAISYDWMRIVPNYEVSQSHRYKRVIRNRKRLVWHSYRRRDSNPE